MNYVLDTNIIIHIMTGAATVKQNRDKATDDGGRFIIPTVVNYEVMRGLIIKSIPKYDKIYDSLRANCTIESVTDDVWNRAAEVYAELYHKRFTVADADILIAAFCLVNGYRLVTDNTNDFKNIDGLDFVNWV